MADEKQTKIGLTTNISVGLLVALLASAISYGVMYQKVEGVRDQMTVMDKRLTALDEKFDKYILSTKSTIGMK